MKHQLFPTIAAALTVVIFFDPAGLPAAGGKSDMPNPDFTKGDAIPKGATHDWTLGPTGTRGWMYSNKLETSEARQIYLTEVELGSPADGVLEVGDVILGLGGEPFSQDPRTAFGKAIGRAEATDGALTLMRWRNGKTESVAVKLPVLGAYSSTAPFHCPKSQRILEQGFKVLAERMKADPGAGNGIVRSLNALALLASGNPDYLPLVREQVGKAAQYSDPDRKSLHSWFYGPATILVAEYTLATGDESFLPDLTRLAREIVRGQSAVGSWGHRFTQPGGRLAGYGMMNSPGIPLTISLILARKAGVEDPDLDRAIENSLMLIRFYTGKGSVPYGDHHPWTQTHDDNGKNGMAAVMFNLVGEAAPTEYFSRMSVASYGAERDTGHTGNFFNIQWALPGVALSGPNASGAWIEEFGWHYDLARRWDGTFVHQGPPSMRPDKYRGWDTTGVYLLSYAQPLGTIHLTGKQPSVAQPVTEETADSLIEDGRGWSPKEKHAAYRGRSRDELFEGLKSWSPVVRERSAMELATRDGELVTRLIELLGDDHDKHARLGACQALIELGKRGAPAVPALRKTLQADDLWLRVKAAEALAAIGDAAMDAVPELLSMLTVTDPMSDPRGMEQRYLTFALFQQRGGLLKNSLEGVDREALYEAVRTGLRNEDGRARGALGSVYRNLSSEEIQPLLPAIHRAVIEPAPSGVMFADGIRLSGLEVLAKHRIAEGLPLCLEVMELDRWGKQGRITKCLNTLQIYRGAARSMLPELETLEEELKAHREAKGMKSQIELVRQTINVIKSDQNPPELRPLKATR
tara:strand:- start:760 stop:3177 length:2418 start_codon:yes stop_codon:yes gene_type:complete